MKSYLALILFSLWGYTLIAQDRKPNIIIIYTDDMGIGDLSCYGGSYQTPNIDKMASEGIRFEQYYSASPICSPSRVGILTGQEPARHQITSYLQTKKGNRACEQADYLAANAPSMAKMLKQAGYKTAHFGKWHMGGGRDVENAPAISEYGFDEFRSTWESPDPDPLLTSSNWIWADTDSIKRWSRTRYFVDKTIDFLHRNPDKPCFINLWPDDMHTPWVGGDDNDGKYEGGPNEEKSFVAVLKEYDRQIGRLLAEIKKMGIDENTLVIFTSDNGPLPNFEQKRSVGLRGTKLSLYEGGIRMPFIVWQPKTIKAGIVDSESVVSALDLLPSFVKLAKGKLPNGYESNGTNILKSFKGKPVIRKSSLFWEYGRNETSFKYPPHKQDRSPSLAIRNGKYKLLMNSTGEDLALYDLLKDPKEQHNIASNEQKITNQLQQELSNWWKGIPRLELK